MSHPARPAANSAMASKRLACFRAWHRTRGRPGWRGARAADIQQIRSPGGISAWLVEEKSLPIIALRFAFDGGSTQEPAGKEGTAGLLAAMLDQGAGDMSGPSYQKQIEKLAVRSPSTPTVTRSSATSRR